MQFMDLEGIWVRAWTRWCIGWLVGVLTLTSHFFFLFHQFDALLSLSVAHDSTCTPPDKQAPTMMIWKTIIGSGICVDTGCISHPLHGARVEPRVSSSGAPARLGVGAFPGVRLRLRTTAA